MAENDDEEVTVTIPEKAAPAASPTPDATASLPGAVSPESAADVQNKLADLKRRQMESTRSGVDATADQLRSNQARVDQAYEASRPSPDMLKPWDQKAKQNEYRTDPVDAFGSIGSIFAMLVPAFVGLPLSESLNAGAAAINAVHASDQQAYDRDYKSWKDNTDLALKRHEVMRQAYNDSILKMNTDLNAGRSMLELNARKFNDEQALMMLEAGLDPDLNKLIDARNKSAIELASAKDAWELQHEKTTDLLRDPEYLLARNTGNKEAMARIIQKHSERWAPGGASQLRYDFTKDYINSQKAKNPDYTPEDLLRWGREAAEAQEAGTDNKRMTGPQADREELEKRKKAIMEADPSIGEIKATDMARQQMLRSKTVPSGNQINRMRSDLKSVGAAIDIVKENLDFLKTHSFPAGAMGQIMRGAEIAGNITGLGTATDRAQFRRRVLELQEIAPRIFLDQAGRPLASAQKKIDAIIAGLNAGDTGPNTIRAYEELLKEFEDYGSNKRLRIEQPYSENEVPQVPSSTGQRATAPEPTRKFSKPWDRDPVIGGAQ